METENRHEEYQYLDLIKNIIKIGEPRNDRTGTGTLSIFSPGQLRFSLRDNRLPLLTTKRVFFLGIVEELLWFIRGETDVRKLHEKNIYFWDQNLHFSARYTNCSDNYDNHGVDQLENIINQIKRDPFSRRIILSAWNPVDTKKMVLPPCHIMAQFYVHCDKSISCHMYQRSCDMRLGLPFNICSYAILTHMLAHVTVHTSNEPIISMGDAHIYKNHIEGLREQIQREPRKFPTILFNRKKENLKDFLFEDFVLTDYNPHKSIKLEMSA
ncbi:thymidylate synthase [Gigaspora rosea]|uniref:thymidylate synthase n=1 Tax=Gigaspora rosea TaxID=44941 RepID=A0A397VYG3_9GLOM|nr:thymidylate synthase [Gigaspora rosea]